MENIYAVSSIITCQIGQSGLTQHTDMRCRNNDEEQSITALCTAKAPGAFNALEQCARYVTESVVIN